MHSYSRFAAAHSSQACLPPVPHLRSAAARALQPVQCSPDTAVPLHWRHSSVCHSLLPLSQRNLARRDCRDSRGTCPSYSGSPNLYSSPYSPDRRREEHHSPTRRVSHLLPLPPVLRRFLHHRVHCLRSPHRSDKALQGNPCAPRFGAQVHLSNSTHSRASRLPLPCLPDRRPRAFQDALRSVRSCRPSSAQRRQGHCSPLPHHFCRGLPVSRGAQCFAR